MTEDAGKLAIQETVAFAVKAHGITVRKGSGLPYIVHPLEVLTLISDWGVTDLETWKATICHDILEDCKDVDIFELRGVIGVSALSTVQDLTFKPCGWSDVPKKEQKQAYLDSFGERCIQALVVKVADRCCNTLDFLKTDPKYAAKYWDKAHNLRKVMRSRREEIAEKFGDRVYQKMDLTLASVAYQIYLAQPDTQ